jgi:glycosyltransferase involved in cell wall biosynthesis
MKGLGVVMSKEPMGFLRIAICGHLPINGYSGGRYFTWVLAEGLAAAGHSVTFWTTARPKFADDFAALPRHGAIRLEISAQFDVPLAGPFDLIFVVPDLGWNHAHYYQALLMARRDRARIVLLNFETPNWFNAYSSEPREPAIWAPSVDVSRSADLILSIAEIGTEYARDFYTDVPLSCEFHHIHPAINSAVADTVDEVPKENQIICPTRFTSGNKHKGAGELVHVLSPDLGGMTLLLMVGIGDTDPAILAELTRRAEEVGVKIELARGLNDAEKFRRIKQSRLMLFLSYFEGFGYPPVEAQYCEVPCVAYDLPVLREVSGDGLIYVPPGDHVALRSAVTEALLWPVERCRWLHERIAPVALFENFTARINAIVCDLAALPALPNASAASRGTFRSWQGAIAEDGRPAAPARRVRTRLREFAGTVFRLLNR